MAVEVSRGRQIVRFALCTVVGFFGATWLFAHTNLGPQLLGIQVNLDEPISPIQILETGRPGSWRFSLLPGEIVPSIQIEGLGKTFMYQGAMMRVDLYTRDGKLIRKGLEGLVDTGADLTYVAQNVMDDADLQPLTVSSTGAGAAGNKIVSKYYQATMKLMNGQQIPLVVATFPVGQNRNDILIGRDLLSQGVLTYDGLRGRATLTFGRADPPVWPASQFYPDKP